MSRAERTLLSRSAALAILLGLVGAFCLGPAAAYLGWIGNNAQRLRRDEAILRHERTVIRVAATPLGARNETGVLFPALGPARAAALLQEALKRRAAAAQVEIEGLQVMPSSAMAGTRRIAVRLRGSAGIGALDRLLYAIETAHPLLYPDNLRIRATLGGTGSNGSSRLRFQLDVSGFTRG